MFTGEVVKWVCWVPDEVACVVFLLEVQECILEQRLEFAGLVATCSEPVEEKTDLGVAFFVTRGKFVDSSYHSGNGALEDPGGMC